MSTRLKGERFCPYLLAPNQSLARSAAFRNLQARTFCAEIMVSIHICAVLPLQLAVERGMESF
jgi:hypothetical protein